LTNEGRVPIATPHEPGKMTTLPQHDRKVRVVLHDGRRLEGDLIVISDRYQVEWVMFDPWEIAKIDDLD
jgi:hypothetical protein